MNKDELKAKLGQRVVELRTSKGRSQSDFTRASGKDRQAIEVIGNGKVNPTISKSSSFATRMLENSDCIAIYLLFQFNNLS